MQSKYIEDINGENEDRYELITSDAKESSIISNNNVENLYLKTATIPVNDNEETIKKVHQTSIGHSRVVKQWEGCVEEIDEKNRIFTAELHEKTSGNTELSAEFSFDDVSEEERKFIKKGNIFYFAIYNQVTNSGQVINGAPILYFRRLPISNWKNFDIDKASEEIEEEYKKLFDE